MMCGFERWLLASRLWKLVSRVVTMPLVSWQVAFPSGGEVLEVGCGGGFNTEWLLARRPSLKVVATDYDTGLVSLARERLSAHGDGVRFAAADVCGLPFADRRFDVVVSLLMLHHVPDAARAAREMTRLVKPGGIVVVADIPGHSVFGPVEPLLTHAEHHSAREVMKALEDAGATVTKRRTLGAAAYLLTASV